MNSFLWRTWLFVAMGMCAVQSLSAGACEPVQADEVLQAERRRLQSQMQNDLEQMSQLLDDQLVYVRNSAVVDSKRSYIDSMRKGDTVYEWIEHENETVRIDGCVAMLTGLGKYDVRIGQKPLKLVLRYLSVWQKSEGQLRLVSWHATRVP